MRSNVEKEVGKEIEKARVHCFKRLICVFDLGSLGLVFTFFFIFLSILSFKFDIFFKRVSKYVILISCRVDSKMIRLIKWVRRVIFEFRGLTRKRQVY